MSKISDQVEAMGARADNIPYSVIELFEFMETLIDAVAAQIPAQTSVQTQTAQSATTPTASTTPAQT